VHSASACRPVVMAAAEVVMARVVMAVVIARVVTARVVMARVVTAAAAVTATGDELVPRPHRRRGASDMPAGAWQLSASGRHFRASAPVCSAHNRRKLARMSTAPGPGWPLSLRTVCLMSSRTWFVVDRGLRLLISAIWPLTNGAAIDVPLQDA
jgi:hypothetical protein